MGKNTKLILILLIAASVFLLAYLLRPERKNIVREVGENQIIIDNFEMAKVIDKENNYYRINAVFADIDRLTNITKLNEFSVVYKKNKNIVDVKGPLAVVDGQEKVSAEGSLEGNVNGINFKTGVKGIFFYDFLLKQGYLKNGIVLTDEHFSIASEDVNIHGESGKLEFLNGVKVTYEK